MPEILDYRTPPPPKERCCVVWVISFWVAVATFSPGTCFLWGMFGRVLRVSVAGWEYVIFVIVPTLSLMFSFAALLWPMRERTVPRGQGLALAAVYLSVVSCVTGYFYAAFVRAGGP